MSAAAKPGAGRKVLAAFLVLGWLALLQAWIFYRERPPEPKIAFPRELRDIPP